MKKEHDWYALAEVIKTVVCPKCAAAEKKQLLALVTDAAVSLETVSIYLSKLTFVLLSFSSKDETNGRVFNWGKPERAPTGMD